MSSPHAHKRGRLVVSFTRPAEYRIGPFPQGDGESNVAAYGVPSRRSGGFYLILPGTPSQEPHGIEAFRGHRVDSVTPRCPRQGTGSVQRVAVGGSRETPAAAGLEVQGDREQVERVVVAVPVVRI